MRTLFIFVCGLCLLPDASAHVYCPKAECERTKQKISRIQSKMRQGYTRRQGERLEAELRRLRAIRSKKCH